MASQISAAAALLKNPPIHHNLPKLEIPLNSSPKSPCFATFGGRRLKLVRLVTSSSNGSSLYSLTAKNVDMVLEEVRPYLIADAGNVDVVSVDNGIISLQLQGACGSCPSSTTTMKMGIERVLKEKFGDAVKDIRQVNGEEVSETTVEAVNRHLDILRPAIKNYGGEVDVIAIQGGDCTVKYDGPDTIGSGIKAAIREKFPEIVNVVFTK